MSVKIDIKVGIAEEAVGGNSIIMQNRNYKTDEEYILDILEDEEERLLETLGEKLSGENKYLFYRYLAVLKGIKDISSKLA